MPRPRDSQKSKLYKAENVLQKGDQGWSYQETQDYVNEVTKTRWWKNRGGPPHVLVRDGRGTRTALAFDESITLRGAPQPATINLPRWARDPIVVIHELSHILTSADEAAHGQAYCQNYLAMVKRFLGEEKHRRLRDSFRENGVKWCPERPQKG